MSTRSSVIANLLFLREEYKKEFDDQVSIGSNWSITSDADGTLQIKHATGGANIAINDLGALETTGSVGTMQGVTIGGSSTTYVPEHTITETNLVPRSLFDNIGTQTLSNSADNMASIQYFDVSIDSDTYVYTENVSGQDMIYVQRRDVIGNEYIASVTLDPIGGASDVQVNGLALNHNGTVMSALLSLQISGVWGTYVKFYTRVDNLWSISNEVTVDAAAQHFTKNMMFSDNGQYLIIGLPTYNANTGAILAYSVSSLTSIWSLEDTIASTDAGTHVGFGTMAFIASDGQTVIGRHSFGGAPDALANVYVFEKNASGWIQYVRLEDPLGRPSDSLFGLSAVISTDGNTMLISDETWSSDTGEIHTYRKNAVERTWDISNSKIRPTGLPAGNKFSKSMETRGKYLIVSAPAGASIFIYIYARQGNKWTEVQKITHAAPAFDAPFHARLCRYEILVTAQLGVAAPVVSFDYGNSTFFDMDLATTDMIPIENNTYNLGSLTLPYKDIYVVNAVTVVSDERKKEEIEECRLGADFINSLRPVTFNWKDGDDADHDGFIAQDIGESDSAIVVPGDVYGIRPEELIAPMVSAIQDLSARLAKFEVNV